MSIPRSIEIGRAPALRLWLIGLTCCGSLASGADGGPRAAGVANVGGLKMALVEFPHARSPGTYYHWLEPGERVDSFELVAIDAKAGSIHVNTNGKAVDLSLGTPATGTVPALNLKDADSRAVLDLYQELSGRTLLRSGTLPVAKLTLQSAGDLSPAAAAELLVQKLRDQGIVVQTRADKYAFATEFSKVPRLAAIPEPPADPVPTAQDAKPEMFPPGLIKFLEGDRDQVLDVYQEVIGRTLLRSPMVPSAKFTVVSKTALSRAQVAWVMEAMFYLAGISVVNEGQQFTFILPGNRNAAAPKVPDNPDEERLKKKPPVAARTLKLSWETSSREALKLYAQLVGREPVLDPAPPPARFLFMNQTSLHAVEAAYALDALATLHQLRFVPVGDKQVKLIRMEQPVPAATR